MGIISTPHSTTPVVTGVAGTEVADLRVPEVPEAQDPVAETDSQTMAGVVAAMAAAVAMPVAETGSRGNQELHHPTETALRLIAADLPPIAGEDSVKVILTV
jgi:hypothetical protein